MREINVLVKDGWLNLYLLVEGVEEFVIISIV